MAAIGLTKKKGADRNKIGLVRDATSHQTSSPDDKILRDEGMKGVCM